MRAKLRFPEPKRLDWEYGAYVSRRMMILLLISVPYRASPLQKAEENTNFADTIDARGTSFAPKLISEGNIIFPASLLKAGVFGIVGVRLDIDTSGSVVSCSVTRHLHPTLDSLVCMAARGSVFSAARENGKAVASLIDEEIMFDADSIAKASGTAEPNIEGIILERDSRTPVDSALVNLMIDSSSKDPELAIQLERYIDIIGKVPGQSCHNGILSATTNAQGHFAFRLLPSMPAKIAVIASGFEIAHFRESPNSKIKTNITYLINKLHDNGLPLPLDTAYMITIYGHQENRECITVETEERRTGLTHYVSRIVLARAPVRQIPESGSSMLVRSGGPFDNRYFVAGIPMLAPFHFAGHPYADIDGVMISTLKNVNVITELWT